MYHVYTFRKHTHVPHTYTTYITLALTLSIYPSLSLSLSLSLSFSLYLYAVYIYLCVCFHRFSLSRHASIASLCLLFFLLPSLSYFSCSHFYPSPSLLFPFLPVLQLSPSTSLSLSFFSLSLYIYSISLYPLSLSSILSELTACRSPR